MPAASPTPATTPLITAILLGCVGVFAIMAGPILTEQLVAVLGMSDSDAGQVFAAEALGTALGPVLATLWMGRLGYRPVAIFALLVVIAGNVLSSLQTGVGPLAALRFGVGLLGQGTAFALAIAIVSSTAQKDRNFAYLIAAQVVLGVLFFLALPFPRDAGIGGVLLPLAGLAGLALLTTGGIRDPQPFAGHGGGAAQGSSATAWMALGVMLIWCTGLGAIWAFIKLIGGAAGLESGQVGIALGISTGVATAGALTASVLAGRIGRIIPVTAALLVQVVMIALLQGEMGFLQFLLTAAVFQSFWNLTGPYIMGTIATADVTGKVSLLIPTAQIGGFFLGPVIAGQFLTGSGYSPANTIAIACCLVALAIFIPTALRLQRPAVAVAGSH
jgi:predicted MFS family arabinose efflux permease